MMIRVDDYVWSEKAFASIKLPKGEASKHFKKSYHSSTRKDDRPLKGHAGRDGRQNDNRNAYGNMDNYTSYRGRDHHAPYVPPRGGYQRRVAPILTLDSLIKPPKEILATKPMLRNPTKLELALESGKLNHLVRDVKQSGRRGQKGNASPKDKTCMPEMESVGSGKKSSCGKGSSRLAQGKYCSTG
ncbi:hypothetical protein Tco_0963928 [Tanacetum coccineum]